MINCAVTCNYLYRFIYIVMVVVVSVEIESCGLHFVVRSFRCVWGTAKCAGSFLTGFKLPPVRWSGHLACNFVVRFAALRSTSCWMAVAFLKPLRGS